VNDITFPSVNFDIIDCLGNRKHIIRLIKTCGSYPEKFSSGGARKTVMAAAADTVVTSVLLASVFCAF